MRIGCEMPILDYRKHLEAYVYDYLKDKRKNADVLVTKMSLRELENCRQEILKIK
jgi:hypothetical protein